VFPLDDVCSPRTATCHFHYILTLHYTTNHWRQRRRGCRGHIPQYFGWGDVNGNIPPQYYYVLSDIADQYWLSSVRSASSRFHSAIRRHQFASVRQAESRLTRLPNLELALTPLQPTHYAVSFTRPFSVPAATVGDLPNDTIRHEMRF